MGGGGRKRSIAIEKEERSRKGREGMERERGFPKPRETSTRKEKPNSFVAPMAWETNLPKTSAPIPVALQ